MRVLVDTTPLRVSRDFRWLWCGQAVSLFGTMLTTAALPFQVFEETGSSLAVGLLGAAELGPLLVCAVVGGSFADRVDKRRLLLGVTTASLLCSATLAVNAGLDHPQLWLLYVVGPVASGATAVSLSVIRSLLPLLLEQDLRPAGFALQSTYTALAWTAGPAVAGVLIGGLGLTSVYVADVATFAVALVAFAGIAPSPPISAVGTARESLAAGLRFLRSHHVILSVFAIDLVAMVFGMPRALFPALAERLGGGPVLYGLLLSSVGAGAFLASIGSGWTTRVRRQGRALLVAVAVWGACIAAAGLTVQPVLVIALFACAGGADMVSAVFRSSIAANLTPDEMRGRVSGVEFAVYAGGPVLGDVESGVVGGLAGVPFAIVSGGVACVIAAAGFAARIRGLATYRTTRRADANPPTVAPS
jgi:MFS family permease